VKRTIDVVGAATGLLVCSPVILAAAIAVRLQLGRPVFWRQQRIGYGDKPFSIVKLRTMREAVDANGKPLPDSERLSTIGIFLRKTSIDEIPQLWNVLKGEMSLVGPRPLYPEYLPCYTPRERQRHTVRPGITGLAQVSGRNHLLWDDRLELDVQYVETQSLFGDIAILVKTIAKVLARNDVIIVPGLVQKPLTHYRVTAASQAAGYSNTRR
jgi:lipopolysaccharide/colanic/teichoic acid biosynthesis glycosyltransferase